MPLSTPFGRATWKLDAALIWSGGLSSIAWFLLWLQGLGVGFAFLLALAAFPLAFMTCILIHHQRELRQYIGDFFASRSDADTRDREQVGLIETEDERKASTDLMLFFLDYILPAVTAQRQLQTRLIQKIPGPEILHQFAVSGITVRTPAVEILWDSVNRLHDAYASSPQEYVTLDETARHISTMEVHYRYLREQTDRIAEAASIDYRTQCMQEWNEWRTAHNALKETYDSQIKRSSRFGALFRPAREGRWGDCIAMD